MRKVVKYPYRKTQSPSLSFWPQANPIKSELPALQTFQSIMAQKGVTTQELSILDGYTGLPNFDSSSQQAAIPKTRERQAVLCRLQNITYSPK